MSEPLETDKISAKRPDYPDLAASDSTSAGAGSPTSLEHLFDVKFDVHAVLGHTELRIKQLLDLASGSVIELDRLISDTVDVVVQGVVVARGEVVVVDDHFAIRIDKIARPGNPIA